MAREPDLAAGADEPFAAEMARFDRLVRTLRAQCPWDREQTHASLRRHLLEETYETLEVLDGMAVLDGGALDRADTAGSLDENLDENLDESLGDKPEDRSGRPDGSADPDRRRRLDESLCEELGDLLYQVWFHSRLASERGAFGVADVARQVHDKLVARHPHVFGDVEADDADAVRANWDVIKQAEKGRDSTMDGIPATLPALLRAVKVLKRAAAAGLVDQERARERVREPDREPAPELDQAAAMLERLRDEPTEQGLGDLLLAVVALGRRLSIDPEDALRAATHRAEQHYRQAERALRDPGP